MKIAWRYQSVGVIRVRRTIRCMIFIYSIVLKSDIGRNMPTRSFDLSTHMPIDDRSQCQTYRFSFADTPTYRSLYNELKLLLESDEYSRSSTSNIDEKSKSKKNILRIAIEGVGSPMWGISIIMFCFKSTLFLQKITKI